MNENPFDAMRESMSDLWDAAREVESACLKDVLSNLMTTADIQEQYGLKSKGNPTNYRARGVNAFPEPVHKFARTYVYWRPDVEKFFADKERHARSVPESDAG